MVRAGSRRPRGSAERNRALSVWGAIAGAGAAVGLLLGGVLVQALSWRWVFFVNVPIGAVVLALAPRIFPELRSESAAKGEYDLEAASPSRSARWRWCSR